MLPAVVLVGRWIGSSHLRLPLVDSSALPGATQLKIAAAVVSRRRIGNPLIAAALNMQSPRPDSVLGIGARLRRPAGLCAGVGSHMTALFAAEISGIVAGIVSGTRPGLWSLLVVLPGLYAEIRSKKSANRRIVTCRY